MAYPLALDINPENWKLFAKRKADPAFRSFAEKVFQRDQHTCQYCDFVCEQYLEVVNLDGDYHNNKLANMVTACPVCYQCHFIEIAGKTVSGGGILIYYPEISQNQLNGLCNVLFCSIVGKTNYERYAAMIYRDFKIACKIVEQKFGKGSSNPSDFTKVLLEAGYTVSDIKSKYINGLRLLPSLKGFYSIFEEIMQDSN